ncbi:MAG TPA: MBL fold metallo-hydrolase [Longimicrobiales bacterium]
MRLRFLGTGTSFGIPVIGCGCATCASTDPRDRRTRHGALLESDDGSRRILIDTPPELRLQLLREDVTRVDAVWFTHAHADHVHGIDDLRAFSVYGKQAVAAWADPTCAALLRSRFPYIFDAAERVPDGTTRPDITLDTYRALETVDVAGFPMLPLPVPHGSVTAFGFRVGDLGYVTDAKTLPDETLRALRGVRVLVLNALRYGRPHPTHFTIDEAVDTARAIGAERTFLTHLTHQVRHAELLEALPAGIEPAYDGLAVEI